MTKIASAGTSAHISGDSENPGIDGRLGTPGILGMLESGSVELPRLCNFFVSSTLAS
jgi:hypothetical protein